MRNFIVLLCLMWLASCESLSEKFQVDGYLKGHLEKVDHVMASYGQSVDCGLYGRYQNRGGSNKSVSKEKRRVARCVESALNKGLVAHAAYESISLSDFVEISYIFPDGSVVVIQREFINDEPDQAWTGWCPRSQIDAAPGKWPGDGYFRRVDPIFNRVIVGLDCVYDSNLFNKLFPGETPEPMAVTEDAQSAVGRP